MTMSAAIATVEAIAATGAAIAAIIRAESWRQSSRLWQTAWSRQREEAARCSRALQSANADRDLLREENERMLFECNRRGRATRRTQETNATG